MKDKDERISPIKNGLKGLPGRKNHVGKKTLKPELDSQKNIISENGFKNLK